MERCIYSSSLLPVRRPLPGVPVQAPKCKGLGRSSDVVKTMATGAWVLISTPETDCVQGCAQVRWEGSSRGLCQVEPCSGWC